MRISDWSSDVCSSDLAISIIRGRGIDDNALDYVASRHGTKNAVFVDGWTGKGAIRGELDASLATSTFKPFLADEASEASRRSEEHTSELQSLMRISYAVFCLKKKKTITSIMIDTNKIIQTQTSHNHSITKHS